MLDGRAAALMSLHTARHGGGHLAGDERILRVVLKVAPAADRTMDVQRRGKPQMHAEVLHLLADDAAAPLHKIRVKALRQRGADGNGRAVLGLDLAAGLRLAVAAHQAHHQFHRAGQHFHNGIRHRGIADSVLALAVLIILLRKAQTGRAVGHDQPGNALDSAAALTRRTADMAACCADHRSKALCVRIKIADQKQGGVLLGQGVHLGQNFLGAGIIYRFTDDRGRVDFDDRHTLRALHRGGRGGKVGEIRAAQHIFCLQGRDGLAQMQDGGGDGFGAADTDTGKVITGLENIGGGFGIISCHLRQGKGAGDSFCFSRGKCAGLGKGAKLLPGRIELTGRLAQVDLHDLPPRHSAGVFHGGTHSDLRTVRLHPGSPKAELCVGKPVSKGEQSFFAEGIKIAVAHIDALAVAGFVHVLKVGHFRVFLKGGPGGRQLAGGIGLAQQNIRQRTAGLDTELGQQQNVAHAHNGGEIHHAADIQHQHKAGELFVQRQNIPHLGIGQADVALERRAVVALTGNAGNNVNCCIALSVERQVVFRLRHDLAHAVEDKVLLGGFGVLFQLLQKGFVGLFPCLLVAGVPLHPGQGKACLLQSFLNGYAVV